MTALLDARHAASPTPLHAGLWRADTLSVSAQSVLASGYAALDAVLPGGGWPVGALCELLQPPGQHSEWRLLVPALAHSGSGAVVLVGPLLTPFGPALAAQGVVAQRLVWLRFEAHQMRDRLWAAEQALRCAEVDAVLLWLPGPPLGAQAAQLRRLHLAAVQHGVLFFTLRESSASAQASAAVLRLAVGLHTEQGAHSRDRLLVEVLKRRGPPVGAPVSLQARAGAMAAVLAAGGAHAVGGTAHTG